MEPLRSRRTGVGATVWPQDALERRLGSLKGSFPLPKPGGIIKASQRPEVLMGSLPTAAGWAKAQGPKWAGAKEAKLDYRSSGRWRRRGHSILRPRPPGPGADKCSLRPQGWASSTGRRSYAWSWRRQSFVSTPITPTTTPQILLAVYP